ncbi:MAG TPA: DUF5684 domain-containing protein [Dongiaceae bacterium]|nr:DUF5684 domain-containing protein [Dongiaceae bacterium]
MMDILHTFAQSYYYYNDGYSSADSSATAAGAIFGLFFVMFTFFLVVVSYVIAALCLMRIFKKAGVASWAAWVPFYNNWKLLEIGGQQGFWAVLAILPIVNIVSAVFLYIAMYNVGLKLGKSGAFVLWAIFIPFVWFIWLAVDKSTWNDNASSAPSLDPAARHGA